MGNKIKVAITGGAGFIGSHLVDRLLSQGYEVTCIDNFDPYYSESIKLRNIGKALENRKFSLYKIDIRNNLDLEKCFRSSTPDLVIHLAAKAGIRPSLANPEEYFDVNVMGTLNVLQTMLKCGLSKLIFASSSSVYGNNMKVPFSELDNVDFPISPYAASKKAGELLCHTFSHIYSFDIFCLRFFTVYGPRQRPDLAIHKFTNNILNNLPIEIYGEGNTSRDYTYVDDIIDGIVSSMKKLKGYEILNFGESKTITLNELITVLESAIKRPAIKKHLPFQPGDVNITFADISKAQRMIDYCPSTSFEDGIRKFIEWKLK